MITVIIIILSGSFAFLPKKFTYFGRCDINSINLCVAKNSVKMVNVCLICLYQYKNKCEFNICQWRDTYTYTLFIQWGKSVKPVASCAHFPT